MGDVVLVLIVLALDLNIWDNHTELRGGGSAPAWTVVAATTLVYLLLLLRWRLPFVVFVVQVAYATAASWVLPQSDFSLAVLVALHAVATQCRPRLSVTAMIACFLPYGMQQYQAVSAGEFTPTGAVVVILLAIGLTLLVWAMGYHSWRARWREAAIARDATLKAEREREAALRAERLRIARELHDIVSHSVGTMLIHAAAAQAVLPTDPARADMALQTIQYAGTQSMTELRRLLGLLRAAGADDASHQPGLAHLDDLLNQMRDAGLTVVAETSGTPRQLDQSVNLTAYRVVQESLTNTMKHAGPGSTVRVHLGWDSTKLRLTVEDRAARAPAETDGHPLLSAGHGLLGLRERVDTVGGTFDAHPIEGGFVTQATLPLTAGPDPALLEQQKVSP